MISKYEAKMSHVKEISLDTMIPISVEDSNTVFNEIDIDGGGSLTLDELFYFVVDKMVGLPYTYRSQINKTIRKIYKLVVEGDKNSLDRQDFFKIMQYIMMWYRIYTRFKLMEDNKNWTTDEKQMKTSGLSKFVQGSSLAEKMVNVTKGKRSEYATFQDYIEYASDFITALLANLLPIEEDDDEELLRLAQIISDLEARLKRLEEEARRLAGEVQDKAHHEDAINKVKDAINGLLKEKENLRGLIERLNKEKSKEFTALSDKNVELERNTAEMQDNFEEYKQKFIAQADRVKTDLNDQIKELNLKNKKAQESGFIKDRLIYASKNEADNLTRTVKYIEANNINLKEQHQNLCSGLDDFKKTAEAELGDLSKNIALTDASIRELSQSIQQLDSDHELQARDYDKLKTHLKNSKAEYEALLVEYNVLLSEYTNKAKTAGQLNVSLEYLESNNKSLSLELDRFNAKVNRQEANLTELQSDLGRLEKEYSALQQEEDSLLANLRNEQKNHSELSNKIKAKLEEKRNSLSAVSDVESNIVFMESKLNRVKIDNEKVQADMRILRMRGSHLESRTSQTLIEHYRQLINKYQTASTETVNQASESKYRFNNVLTSTDQPDWDEEMRKTTEKETFLSELQEDFSKTKYENENLKSQVNKLKSDLQGMSDLKNTFNSQTSKVDSLSKQFGNELDDKLEGIHTIRDLSNLVVDYQSDVSKKQLLESYSKASGELDEQIQKTRNANADLANQIKRFEDDFTQIENNRNQLLNETRDYENLMSTMRTEIDSLKNFRSNNESNSPGKTEKSFTFETSVVDMPVKEFTHDSPLKMEDLSMHSHSEKDGHAQYGKGLDKVDDLVKEFNRAADLKVKFKRIGDRKYKYGTRIVNMKVNNESVMVRVGGGWKSIGEFVAQYEDEESHKLDKMRLNVQNSLDEDTTVKKKKSKIGGLNKSRSDRLLNTSVNSGSSSSRRLDY